ncbi:hypothetical protein ACHQM5_029244 [Ranunculus cassubicifolius]
MSMASQHEHIVIFPFMAQGHTLPLLDLSKAFSGRGVQVTIITTPANAPLLQSYIAKQPLIGLKEIPFPYVPSLPKGCENTAHLPSMELYIPFLFATKQLQLPFHEFLQDMSDSGSLPLCVISDFFLGWTLETCRSFGIPRLVFHGMGVLSMAICKTVWTHAPHLKASSETEPLHLPGLNLPFTLTTRDLPESIRTPNHDDLFSRFVSQVGQADIESWGVIVNSFFELEQPHVSSFESFYINGAKAWCLGPLLLYNETNNVKRSLDRSSAATAACTEWLTEKAMPSSVVYVSFGTQADVSDAQLNEIAFGLEMSGYSFLWVVRSTTWLPPNGIEERVKNRGLIVRDWVDQRLILGHRSIGGFLSHCGWNSVLESLSVGVPILAWPMMAEQSLNAMLVVEGFNAGVRLPLESHIVGRKAACHGVRELMEGNKSSHVKERAQALGRAAVRAVQQGGTSYQTTTELIDRLRASRNHWA